MGTDNLDIEFENVRAVVHTHDEDLVSTFKVKSISTVHAYRFVSAIFEIPIALVPIYPALALHRFKLGVMRARKLRRLCICEMCVARSAYRTFPGRGDSVEV